MFPNSRFKKAAYFHFWTSSQTMLRVARLYKNGIYFLFLEVHSAWIFFQCILYSCLCAWDDLVVISYIIAYIPYYFNKFPSLDKSVFLKMAVVSHRTEQRIHVLYDYYLYNTILHSRGSLSHYSCSITDSFYFVC